MSTKTNCARVKTFGNSYNSGNECHFPHSTTTHAMRMTKQTGSHRGTSTHTHGMVVMPAKRRPMKSKASHSKKLGLLTVKLISLQFLRAVNCDVLVLRVVPPN